MRTEYEGISLWYGTSDAPAPEGVVATDSEISITAAVYPFDPSNAIEVIYRVNKKPPSNISARHLRRPGINKTQYFQATLPNLEAGDTVEYTVVCRCAGRQVPPKESFDQFTTTFTVQSAKNGESLPTVSVVPEQETDANEIDKEMPAKEAVTNERSSTEKVASLAGLPANAIQHLIKAAPVLELLSEQTIASLVEKGLLNQPGADRLGLALIALELAEGDETAAAQLMAAFDNHEIKRAKDLAALPVEKIAAIIEAAKVTTLEQARKKAATLKSRLSRAFPTATLMVFCFSRNWTTHLHS